MTLSRARRGVTIALAASAIVTSIATAQTASAADAHHWPSPSSTPTASALAEAQALYIAGNRAVDEGRWSDALSSFERSYALSGVAAALYNVATTLRAIGRHVESRDAFVQLLDKHPKLDPDVRAQAEKMLAEEKERIASLIISGLPSKKDDLRITLDGQEAKDDGSRPFTAEVDPGHHALRVEEPKSKPFTWEGKLATGEKKGVTVSLVPLPPPPPKDAPQPSSSVLSSPIFWTVVGVVVVGGAVVGGYLYHESKQLDPGSPNTVKL